MTKFTDQLFDDLMQEHGPALAATQLPTVRKRRVAHPVRLSAVAAGIAAAGTAVGVMMTGSASPAYAVTSNADGTTTVAVYQNSGIAQANAKLRSIGGRVFVVPVGSHCPGINALRAPAVPANPAVVAVKTEGGRLTLQAKGIPAGDLLVAAFPRVSVNGARYIIAVDKLTSGHAPACVSVAAHPGSARG